MDHNWLSPAAEARPVGDHGGAASRGRPSRQALSGGLRRVRRSAVGAGDAASDRQSRSIQVDDDLFLVSGRARAGRHAQPLVRPSCGLVGSIVLVALRDLEVGEELTFDYATCDGTDYDEFVCACGAATCRGRSPGGTGCCPSCRSATPAGSRPTWRGGSRAARALTGGARRGAGLERIGPHESPKHR